MGTSTPSIHGSSALNGLPPELIKAHQLGCRLLPCRPQTKVAAITKWPKRATNDLFQIQAWSKEHPNCNWAAATGPDSGFFVIDIDEPQGVASVKGWMDMGKVLPPTLAVNTARGKHLYFRWPNELVVNNSVCLLAPGIDVRGIGGYAIIPPSQHPSGSKYSYENRTAEIAPAPEWLLELLSQTRRDSLRPPDSPIAKGQRNS